MYKRAYQNQGEGIAEGSENQTKARDTDARYQRLRVQTFRERLFDFIKISDPTIPEVPDHLKIKSHFTAPFKEARKEK